MYVNMSVIVGIGYAAIRKSPLPDLSDLEHQSFFCVSGLSLVYLCPCHTCCLQSGTQDDEATFGTIVGDGKETLNYALALKCFCFYILLAEHFTWRSLLSTR